MSKNKHQEVRFRVLNECFRNQHKHYTLDDLMDACNEALKDIYGVSISKRTLYDDIDFMKDSQGFNAPIVTEPWEGRKPVYRYSDPDFSIYNMQLKPEELDKLKATLEMLSRYKGLPQFDWMEGFIVGLEDKFGVRGNDKCVIGLEQNLDYKGVGYLSGLLDAIINKLVLQIKYRTFEGVEYDWTIHPYYIKQYNSRWFLFGRNHAKPDSICNIPLDRIEDIKPSKIKYMENDLAEFEDYFDDIVGVTQRPGQEECKVRLKFDQARFPYVLTKPLHGSMKIKDKENGIVELSLKPNKELESLIFSFGNQVEVLEPQWLREQMAEKVAELHKKYAAVKVDCTDNN